QTGHERSSESRHRSRALLESMSRQTCRSCQGTGRGVDRHGHARLQCTIFAASTLEACTNVAAIICRRIGTEARISHFSRVSLGREVDMRKELQCLFLCRCIGTKEKRPTLPRMRLYAGDAAAVDSTVSSRCRSQCRWGTRQKVSTLQQLR